MQLTFERGNYTGHWVEGSPGSGSGSLEILYKGVQEVVLHDKAETAAIIIGVIIAGVVALSLVVPVAFVVYLGALVLFSDLKEDDEM